MNHFFGSVSRLPRHIALFALALTLVFCTAAAVAKQALILGVHPYLSQAEIKKRFKPLAEYLGNALEMPVRVRAGQSYQDHLHSLNKESIDIAYLGPSLYVETLQGRKQCQLLARLEAGGKPTFQGHIVVNEHSELSQIGDLKGKIFAFGDPYSTMSTLVPRAMLDQAGVALQDLAGYRHYTGHVNVALAVLGGDADAGAVKEEVYAAFRARGLRSLKTTPAISEHVFVTRANLQPALAKRIKALLLSIRSVEQVETLLKPIKKTATGMVPADPADYDNLRQLMDRLDK